jgi:hypothetical protein
MKLILPRSEWHTKIYLFGLALLVCCLPLSRYLLSVAQFLLAVNWIAEGGYRAKIRRIKNNPSIILFASIFLLYVIGFLFSENSKMGLAKVNNALPFLMLPIVIGTSEPLTAKNRNRLLLLFSAAIVAASLVCLINYIINGIPENGDFRQISIFIPHLRFALLIDMAIAILLYYSMEYPDPVEYPDSVRSTCQRYSLRAFFLFFALYLTFFLFFLRSATGLAIFAAVIICLALNFVFRIGNKNIRYLISAFVLLSVLALFLAVSLMWQRNFHAKPFHSASLEKLTLNGNAYFNDTASLLLENGHYTELYICETEMKQEWDKVSTIKYMENDKKGQPLSSTLKRYLTSRGLRKDSAGISHLTSADISNIEDGLANYRFTQSPGIWQRLYETLYDIHVYRQSGFANQHSVGQRLVFLGSGISLIRDMFPFGTGTGDVYERMKQKVRLQKLEIDPAWEGKPHNQFVFLLLALGLPGFLWWLISLIYPAAKTGAYKILLFNILICISFLSMLVMDTLESYDSVVFFTFFYCLFSFYNGKNA